METVPTSTCFSLSQSVDGRLQKLNTWSRTGRLLSPSPDVTTQPLCGTNESCTPIAGRPEAVLSFCRGCLMVAEARPPTTATQSDVDRLHASSFRRIRLKSKIFASSLSRSSRTRTFKMPFWAVEHGCELFYTWFPTGILLVACLLLLEFYRRHSYMTTGNLPPGSSGWPIIGETLPFILDGNKYMRERIARYGVVFRSSILGQNIIVVSGADNVRQILLGECTSVVTNHPISVRALIGEGTLSNTTGERHNELHRFISKTFHLTNLQLITPAVHRVIGEFVARWRRSGYVISGVSEMKKLAFTLGANVLLGLNFASTELETVMTIFETFNQAFFTFPIDIPGFAYYKGKLARQELIELLTRYLKELPNKSNDKRVHLIHDLMERHQRMSSESDDISCAGNLINMTIELMFGSNESLASGFSSILMYLGHRPDVYSRIHEELARKDAPSAGDPLSKAEPFTYDDVKEAHYVHHVVNEVLRIYPPIAGSFRKTIKPMKIAGYDIPVGWTILYSIPSTHLLSPLFAQKTNELIPERWQTKEEHDQYPEEDDNVIFDQELGEKLKSKERFHYIPFGAGHRRCVGKEFALLCMRVFIMEVVRTGKLQLVNGFPEIKTCPFVYPKDNLPLWFEKSRC
ncbi:hypothetical protein LSH36_892g00037 [Paralvinella palmiformis]|uniref:Cytochrome P450 n=1 Tax=Paralvinella palmiformis TaxID=53620 RepID=A0AAD9IYN2_9ANNE|nr:hypothetical protein LSH36_892g00037 [Paralvinella palmiformis]